MPRVERDAEVTLVTLCYRSTRWLDFVMEGVDRAETETRYRWLVVGCDANEEVKNDPRLSYNFTNDDPSEFYINRVYRAWNSGVLEAPTQNVVLLNSDMYVSDEWLDALLDEKREHKNAVPTSVLVESGRLPSGMPEKVKNFGMTPEEFRPDEFLAHAEKIRAGGTSAGRLYMPILINRQEFIDVGMYPEGNPPGTTGDKDLIRRYAEAGFEHVTVHGSMVYHCVCGEQNWPEKSQG